MDIIQATARAGMKRRVRCEICLKSSSPLFFGMFERCSTRQFISPFYLSRDLQNSNFSLVPRHSEHMAKSYAALKADFVEHLQHEGEKMTFE